MSTEDFAKLVVWMYYRTRPDKIAMIDIRFSRRHQETQEAVPIRFFQRVRE